MLMTKLEIVMKKKKNSLKIKRCKSHFLSRQHALPKINLIYEYKVFCSFVIIIN